MTRVETAVPSRRWRRPRSRFGSWWAVLALAVLMALVLATRPGLRLVPSPEGLAEVVRGLATRVTHADLIVDHRRIPVVFHGNTVIPKTDLMPGMRATLVVTAASMVPAWPKVQRRLEWVTPPAPRILDPLVHLRVGAAVPIRLSRPVAAVRLGRRPAQPAGRRPAAALWEVSPRRLPLGVAETRTVYVRPRPWEAWTPAGRLTWVTPAPLAVAVVGATARTVTLQFSRPLTAPRTATWRVVPAVPGRWEALGPTRYRFTADAAVAWWPGTTVTITLPGGPAGPMGTGGIWLNSATTAAWTLPNGSPLRAQQLLATLGYLPLTWTPSGPPIPTAPLAQWQAIYHPPAGTFHWRWTPMPAPLTALFQPGVDTVMLQGAVMQFEHDQGLQVDGVVGPAVWHALVLAANTHQDNPHGYSWVYVSETLPELLTLWHNGHIVLTSLANTGIPASPTALGTYPVYLRYRSQTMRGINPNGTPYVDPGVPYVNYFYGGDAVHGFVRPAYGFPQSLGCVELPPAVAGAVWPYLHYGTLVTVDPPGSPRRLAA